MPRIFDNIDRELLPALKDSLKSSHRADFCVGYFNLRGWRHLSAEIEHWPGGEGSCCRLLVGMPVNQEDLLKEQYSLIPDSHIIDQPTVVRLKQQMARKFREQLTIGAPTDADQIGLAILRRQLKARKLVVKLFLRYPLHAKLYLNYREDANNPITAFLGSSNLTHSGLLTQGELNIDVLDHDATEKLKNWFEERWKDKYCLDITDELTAIIDQSWVTTRTPYQIYIKMAYHLSREARMGVEGFEIPAMFRGKLFEFQTEAVKIAAHHLEKRGGVLIGDVVGLGKTIMAAAVAKLYIERQGAIPLIICPPNLMPMWQKYSDDYDLYAKILSLGSVRKLTGDFSRHKLVIVDESHNLRNRESDRYKAVKEYIDDLNANVILLSATPYNKGYEDISSQLRLFVNEDQDLGVRPEAYIRSLIGGEIEFNAKHQCPVHSIRAFEHSPIKEDWQQLMQRYMVRRTRTFIKKHYASTDSGNGRKFLELQGGGKAYFPERVPHTVAFEFDDGNQNDPYARLFSDKVVDIINHLELPRYGLGNYLKPEAGEHANNKESIVMKDLGRAGKRLMGFCRTNLYKRLESCGDAFLKSIERHIVRNYLFAHAIENDLPLPIGTQEPWMLDTRTVDADSDNVELLGPENIDAPLNAADETLFDELLTQKGLPLFSAPPTKKEQIKNQLKAAAKLNYECLHNEHVNRFSWIRPTLFQKSLYTALCGDADQLISILAENGSWKPDKDRKLRALHELLAIKHANEKVLVFTQFADTADYLHRELGCSGITASAEVTGGMSKITEIASRFSPISNGVNILPPNELRVLIATDVISEGQNLQDSHVIVNFDLPWAIIRLVQRAGRVDRIGQQAESIHCYSFVPMKGVERIIRLRAKVRHRLNQNAEVVGSDEMFFDDDGNDQPLVDLYNEKAGILDGTEDESEVDLQSRAFQIVKEAFEGDPTLEKTIKEMPDVVYSAKSSPSACGFAPERSEGGEPGGEGVRGRGSEMTQPSPKAPTESPAPYTTKTKPPSPAREVGEPANREGGRETSPGVIVYIRTSDEADALAYVDEKGASITENQSEILDIAKCEPATPTAERSPNHHTCVRKGVQLLIEREQKTGGQLGRPSGARYRAYHLLKRYLEANTKNLLIPPSMSRALEQILKYPLRQLAADIINREFRHGAPEAQLAESIAELYEENRLCHVEDDVPMREPRIICSLGVV